MFRCHLPLPDRSFFLFGPRGTGKTTWLRGVPAPPRIRARAVRRPAGRRGVGAETLDGRRWLELASLADVAEKTADSWWPNRLADPSQISNLLDTVYSARLAILDAREHAGLAGCAVTAATGLPVSEWR